MSDKQNERVGYPLEASELRGIANVLDVLNDAEGHGAAGGVIEYYSADLKLGEIFMADNQEPDTWSFRVVHQ